MSGVTMLSGGESPKVEAGGYCISLDKDRFAVELDGVPYFTLRVGSGLHTDKGQDTDILLAGPEVSEDGNGVTFLWRARSNLWEEKQYILECRESWFRYRLKVFGKGKPRELDYFSGASWEKGSAYEAGSYLYPAPEGGGTQHFYRTTAQNSSIVLHYLIPPLFCYPFSVEDCPRWLGLGLAAEPGQYNFDHFSYIYNALPGGRPRCYFQTDFMGYTQVDGEWEVPAILGVTADEEYAVLSAYSDWHYKHGGCVRPVRHNPDWWLGPLFCGWSEQNALCPDRLAAGDEKESEDGPVVRLEDKIVDARAIIAHRRPQEAANQLVYEGMSARLDELGLEPTAIIVDAKWQDTFGRCMPDPAKWPDMRAFVDAEHRKGRKVVLWFKAWDSEGLPSDECVVLWGQQMGADPTNPRYRERLRQMMLRLLSDEPGCYDCDGFKIDFANCMPLGLHLRTHEPGVYGVELLKRFFLLFRDEAKAVKADALINCSCAHPYFAEVTDQMRLHDYYWGLRTAVKVMSHRQKLARCAMPDVLIDTDGVLSTHREAMSYMRRTPELGVPDLYTLTGGPDGAGDFTFDSQDWQEIKRIWQEYAEHRGERA